MEIGNTESKVLVVVGKTRADQRPMVHLSTFDIISTLEARSLDHFSPRLQSVTSHKSPKSEKTAGGAPCFRPRVMPPWAHP